MVVERRDARLYEVRVRVAEADMMAEADKRERCVTCCHVDFAAIHAAAHAAAVTIAAIDAVTPFLLFAAADVRTIFASCHAFRCRGLPPTPFFRRHYFSRCRHNMAPLRAHARAMPYAVILFKIR